MEDILQRVQIWYSAHCDGDWEHQYGVSISTIDNPGWEVTIDFDQTPLSDIKFESITINRTEENWLRCFVKDDQFKGFGGTNNLSEILTIFLDWAKQKGK